MISDAALGHTLVIIVVADPTRRDLAECVASQDLVVATNTEQRNETHYRDNEFFSFALEPYGALSNKSDNFLVECATLASRGCAESGPCISLLCTWFRHRVSIALQRSHMRYMLKLYVETIHGLVASPTTACSTFFFGVACCCKFCLVRSAHIYFRF